MTVGHVQDLLARPVANLNDMLMNLIHKNLTFHSKLTYNCKYDRLF